MGIDWPDNLAVGDERIDSQHRELIDRFNQLLSACRRSEGKQELLRLIEYLDEYVLDHFTDEERLQRSTGYPGYKAHKLEHIAFTKQLFELKRDMAAESEVQIEHLLATNKMLIVWLSNHIFTSDKALAKYLKSL